MRGLIIGLCLVCSPGYASTDKALHALAGVGISIAVTEIAEANGVNRDRAKRYGCIASIVAGIAKEAYDSTGRGTVDVGDAIWTGGPGCLVLRLRW